MSLRISVYSKLASAVSLLLIVLLGSGCASVESSFPGKKTPQSVAVAVIPSQATITVSSTQKFSATVTNTSNTAVTWQVNGVTGGENTHGTIDSAGTYRAPAAVPTPAVITITAVSQSQSNKSGSAQATLVAAPSPVAVTVSPSSASVEQGHTQTLEGFVQNDSQNKGLNWSLSGPGCSGAACGTLSSSTSASGAALTYTAPAVVPNPPVVTATAASVADGTKSANATLTVTASSAAAISVAVNPTSASVQAGQSHSVTATVQNDSQNKGVTWDLSGAGCNGATCGTLSATASASGAAITYTAPASVPAPAAVSLTATSATDATKTAVTIITITGAAAAISVNVNPPSASVQTGKTQSLTAQVQNDSQNKGVAWTLSGAGCSGSACGTLSASASASGSAITYTAPVSVPSPATVRLTAKSVADSTKSATATITVTSAPPPAISVVVNPTAASVQTGKTQSVTATVQNDSQNLGVSWTLTGSGCTGAACGTLSATTSASGSAITYTAPGSAPNPATVTLTAKSASDATKIAAATFTISAVTPPAIAVAVSPTSLSIITGQSHGVTATLQNDTQKKGVSWTLTGSGCSGAACGTLSAATSASGTAITYTAPANVPSPATVTLTAKSAADGSKSASTTITITTAAPASISVSVNPTGASVQTNQTHSVTATVQNDAQNKGVTWTLGGAGCGGSACGTLSATTSASGTAITYTAPASVPAPATVTLNAKSAADATKTATATFTITGVVSGNVKLSISPKRVGLTIGQQQTFTATVTGSSNTAVNWEVDTLPGGSSATGTISATGVYSPPSTPGTHTVAARSVADSTVSASASVAITDLTGVFTYHNDLARDGANLKEYALNSSTVTPATFGKRFACALDAAAYAQPLWVANVAIGGGIHNVVIAATQHDTVYAFDADAAPCQTYWQKSLLNSGETWVTAGDVGTDDITPDIGIVGTPVIDPATNSIYLVSKSRAGSNFHQRLHALNLSDGSERFNGPREIAFTSGGKTFDPLRQNERAGLALVNGTVYIAYASHGDNPTYYGWMVGYDASTLELTTVFNDDPTSAFGGIWMSGGAPAADSARNLYVTTGNGEFDGNINFGDSFLRLSTSGGLRVTDYFSPDNQGSLNSSDLDFGSGGAALLVDQPSGPVPRLVIGGGKDGRLWVLNRDNLGGNGKGDKGAVQTITLSDWILATPAFWQNTLYLAARGQRLQAYSFNTNSGKLHGAPDSQSSRGFGVSGSTPSVSSEGGSNGIVWAIEKSGTAVLHAYDATNLNNELWNSGNSAGGAVKFSVPTVANGKVYVGTQQEISVYGLLPD